MWRTCECGAPCADAGFAKHLPQASLAALAGGATANGASDGANGGCGRHRALAQILAATGQAAWAALATRLPVDATCADLDMAFTREHDGPPLAGLAALLYRLQPNVRLL
jgi:hypothetical protein